MRRRVVAAIGAAMVIALLAGTQVGASAGSSGGTQAWDRIYADGQAASGKDVLVSGDGRTVFVTGSSTSTGNGHASIVTLAYDAATGERRWLSTWTPGRDSEGGEGSKLALSPDGSVLYVAGKTWCRTSCEGDTFTTLAFDATSGERLWVSRVPNEDGTPSGIAVTPDGSRIVVYGGAVFYDRGRTFALDTMTGRKVWSQDHPYYVPWTHGLTLSADGTTAYVVGTDVGTDVCGVASRVSTLIAYDMATGTESSREGVACGWATAVDLTPDGSGLVVGGANQYQPRGFVVTVIDRSSGDRRWSTLVPGPDYSGERSPDIALTPDGSQVIISGQERAPSQLIGVRTVSLDLVTGDVTWQRFFEGTGYIYVAQTAISPDGSTVFVTGQDQAACSYVPCDPRDYSWGLVLAYDARTGDERWVSTYAGGFGWAVTSSPDGSRAYLAGHLVPDSTGSARLRARAGSCSSKCGIASVSYNNTARAYRTEDPDVGIRWSGWTGRFIEGALGGSDRLSRTPGAVTTYRSAARDVVRWVTRVGPTMGIARLLVDGRPVGSYDLYAPRVARRVVKVEGLSEQRHRVEVVATGRRNAAAKGAWVVADAFAYNLRRDTKQENTRQVGFGAWRTLRNAAASGGSFRISTSRADRASMTFRGGTVRLVTARGPAYGKARVVVDGKARRVNLYSARREWRVPIVFTGLGKGTHTISVRPLGLRDARSRGKSVVVDAFVVRP